MAKRSVSFSILRPDIALENEYAMSSTTVALRLDAMRSLSRMPRSSGLKAMIVSRATPMTCNSDGYHRGTASNRGCKTGSPWVREVLGRSRPASSKALEESARVRRGCNVHEADEGGGGCFVPLVHHLEGLVQHCADCFVDAASIRPCPPISVRADDLAEVAQLLVQW